MDVWTGSFPYRGGDVKILGLFSDLHLEAADHDRERLVADLEQAKAVGARLSFNGDLFDLILPSDRKRYARGSDSIDADAQLNLITERGAEFLSPYADLIDVISVGNHEEVVLRRHHYDIVRGVIALLNRGRDKSLPPIHQGAYKGFQRYRFQHQGTGYGTLQFDICRFHGTGGGAPVTKGIIDFNRLKQDYRADLYWVGHKHTAIIDNGMKEIGIGPGGRLYTRQQRGVTTAGYKQSVPESDPDKFGHIISFSDTMLTAQAEGCAWVILKLSTNVEHSPTGTGIEWTVSDKLLFAQPSLVEQIG